MMNPETALLFACARPYRHTGSCEAMQRLCSSQQLDWDAVFAVAKEQGIAPFVYTHLQALTADESPVPAEVISQFRREFYTNRLHASIARQQLQDSIAFLRSKSIDVLLIKGCALNLLVYAPPWSTVLSDIDLVLFCRREAVPEQIRSEIMQHFAGTGVEYEYYDHHDVTLNGAVPVDFEQIWRDAHSIQINAETAYVMAPEAMLLSLCLNSCRKRYFRLKSLCDIAETLDRYPALDWQQFAQMAKRFQCNTIAYTALLVTQMTIGCRLPDSLLAQLAVNPVRARLIAWLAHSLLRHAPLPKLSSASTIYFLGRSLTLPLLLVYLTYNWHQARHKLHEAYQSWQRQSVENMSIT